MNFVLGWELTPERVEEYAREHGFDKEEPDNEYANDSDNGDDTLRAKKQVMFSTVVGDIYSRAGVELFSFRACWDVDGNEFAVFAVVEEEADRLIDVRCTAADLPPEQDMINLRTLLNHPDRSPKWYIHANGRWPGDDRVRAALDMTFDDEGDLNVEGTEGEGGAGEGEGEETEAEVEHLLARSLYGPTMNFVLGWELTPQRVLEYAQEHGFDKPEPDDNDSDDDDSNDTLRRAKKAVIFFTVVDDIHSRATMELVRFRACWDVEGNHVGVFVVVEEEADRLIDVRCTAADLPPEQDLVDLRTLLNHPDPSPKWYIHANGRWPGDDRVRAALDMTFDDEGALSGEGTEAEGEVGEGEETEDEDQSTPKMSADVTKTTSQMKELQI